MLLYTVVRISAAACILVVLNRSLVSPGISVRRTIKSVQQQNSQSEWLPPVLCDRDGVHVRVTSQSLRSTHWTTWQSSRQVSQLQRLIEVHHQNVRNLLKIPLSWENTQHCLPNSIYHLHLCGGAEAYSRISWAKVGTRWASCHFITRLNYGDNTQSISQL